MTLHDDTVIEIILAVCTGALTVAGAVIASLMREIWSARKRLHDQAQQMAAISGNVDFIAGRLDIKLPRDGE